MLVILSVAISSRAASAFWVSASRDAVSHDLNGKLVVEMWWG